MSEAPRLDLIGPGAAERVYDSVVDMLPSPENPTPLVRLRRVVPFQHTRVYAKVEWFNPSGAIKDRVAAHLVREAEERGVLEAGHRLVEATSGNTGMGLAMMAAAHGYRLTTPMSSAVPKEKRDALRFAGVDVEELADDLCPAPGQPEGAMARAAELGSRPGARQLDQYTNPANPDAHYRSTGPEIWRQTGGAVTHFFAALGTCGTITGTGRYLQEQGTGVQVVGVHPCEDHDVPGVRSLRQLQHAPFFAPERYAGLVEVQTEEAWSLARRLAREEGLMAGPSSGMALAGALRTLPDEPGLVAVVIFADSIYKYTSSLARHDPDQRGPSAASDEGSALLSALVDVHRASSDHIDATTAEELADEGAIFVDVRDPEEFAAERVEGSVNLPLDELLDRWGELPRDLDRPVVTLCRVGRKSLYATLLLKAVGYRRVVTVMGGLEGWQAEGLPLVFGAD